MICREEFDNLSLYKTHKKTHKPPDSFELINNALRGVCTVFRKTFPSDDNRPLSIHNFFSQEQKTIKTLLLQQLQDKSSIKCSLVLGIEMIKTDANGEEEDRDTIYFKTKVTEIYFPRKINSFLKEGLHRINQLSEDFTNNGSNWRFNGVEWCDIQIGKCSTLTGGCAIKKIEIGLPKEACKLSPTTKDTEMKLENSCLLYAVAAYFTKSKDIAVLEDFIKKQLNVKIKMPAKVKQLTKFEKDNNHLDFKINLLHIISENIIYPLRVSPYVNRKHVINLAWKAYTNEHIDNENKEEDIESESDEDNEDEDSKKILDRSIGHFFLIKNINRFLTLKNQNYRKAFYCVNCLQHFSSEIVLKKHQRICFQNKPQILLTPTPEKDNIIQFKNFNKKFPVPYIGIYDFEALLIPQQIQCDICSRKQKTCLHKSQNINKQIPITFSILIIDRDKHVIYKKTYSGENCISIFLNTLIEIEKQLAPTFQINSPLAMSRQDQINYDNASICHICEKPLSQNDKVRDHNHFNGQFLGAAHSQCNLQRQEAKFIPMFAHNSANYDSHFIIEAMKYDSNIEFIRALPTNTEKFKTFELNCFRFIDSIAFLNSSLDNLANDLHTVPNFTYKILDQSGIYSDPNDPRKALLLRKGVFPYEYLTDISKLKDDTLPDISKFFSSLYNSTISAEDYNHAKTVFREFNCKTLQDYCELYCKLDVALLAEIIFNFRFEILSDIGLDICWYISLPQLAMDSMLKITKINIELLTDINDILMVEQNIRGGLSYIGDRLCEKLDSNEEMIYIDANNLYGYAMSQHLPISDFRSLNEAEWSSIDWHNIDTKSDKGYILEVDLHYPEHLHIDHNSYVLAPEHFTISLDMLSPYAKQCYKELNHSKTYKANKLTCTFLPRKHYVTHFANLKFYLQQGLILTKIHSVLSFTQKAFLKPYIDYCTQKRKASTSSFQGNVYKLLSNSLFGKFIEGVRERMTCHFVNNEKIARRRITHPGFESFKILNNNLVVIFSKKRTIFMDKAYTAGFTILEQSKLFMYEYYYNILKKKFQNITVLMTDTDSFALKVTKYEKDKSRSAMDILKDYIDFSNYPISHPLYNKTRKNELGYFKDELAGQTLEKFIGVRSKTYVLQISKKKDLHRRTKGVRKPFRSQITMENFENCLRNIDSFALTQYQIRSNNHKIFTKRVKKNCFSSFEDKRYLLCPIHSVPYGSIIIKLNKCPYCIKNQISTELEPKQDGTIQPY